MIIDGSEAREPIRALEADVARRSLGDPGASSRQGTQNLAEMLTNMGSREIDGVADMELARPTSMHWVTFLRQWLKSPRRMASVAPSGRQLGALMAAALPARASHVVELGAGTGAITEALMRHGIAPQHLLAVELNPVLHELLRDRFPRLHLAHGDARHLDELIAKSGAFAKGEVDAVCSSLGLLSMPDSLQHDILAAAFGAMRPGGSFVQYTYGLRSPVSKPVAQRLGLTCRAAGLAWRNLPPARVFVYTQERQAG